MNRRRIVHALQIPYLDPSGSVAWRPRPDGWSGVKVRDQDEAEARLPKLPIGAPDATTRFVVVVPEGPIGLSGLLVARDAVPPFSAGPHARIDWVIVRGYNGPIHENWVRSIRDQCLAAGVAFFYEQKIDGRRWEEFPEISH